MRCYNCMNSKFKKVNKDYECYRMSQCLMEDVENREKYQAMNIKEGDKILFAGEKRYWTVVAASERFKVCIRKHRGICYHTICDLYECIRGGDNYHGEAFNYENLSEYDKEELLARLELSSETPIERFNVSEKLKKKLLDEHYSVPEWKNIPFEIEPVDISYRNWVKLDIAKVY